MHIYESSARRRYPYLVIAATSMVICLILFYIDEARYRLEGLFKFENIPAMLIYFFGFNMAAILIYKLLILRFSTIWSLMVALVLTLLLGFLFALVIFYLTSWFL